MTGSEEKTLVSRLADAGEGAIQRLAGAPGADRVTGAMTSMRERMDDMQKKLRGLDELGRRLEDVEQRLDKLEGKKGGSSKASEPKASARKASEPGAAEAGKS